MPRMEFGLFLDLPTEATTVDRHVAAYRELIALAETQGMTSIWAGESYPRGGGGFQHVPSPMLVLASLATSTHMSLGTGVTLAPAWQPLRLAYDGLLMDHISSGRFTLGLGLGSAPTWKQFGIDRATLGEWVDELIDALKALWSGADGYAGRLIEIEGPIGPPPVRPGGPPIWVGGKIARSARRAALHADGYLAGTHFGSELIHTQIERYRAALTGAGRDPAGGRVSVNRILVLADDEESAWRDARPGVGRLLRKYAALKMFPGWDHLSAADPADLAALRTAAAGMCLIGTPTSVRAELEAFAAAGVTQIQLRPLPGGLDPSIAAQTLELAGRELIPRFS